MFNAPKPAMFHMLKSLGIDPEQLQTGIDGISKFTTSLDQRLSAMERKLDRVLILLEAMDYNTGKSELLPVQVLSPEDAGLSVTPVKSE